MARVALFGGSHFYNLHQFCNGNLNVPSDIAVTYKFFAYPDLRADHVTFGHIEEVLQFSPDAIIISIGENDINKECTVNYIVRHIASVIEMFRSAGVRTVFVAQLMRKGHYGDSYNSELSFKRISRAIHKKLWRWKVLSGDVRSARGIQSSEHFCKDNVNLNDKGNAIYSNNVRDAIVRAYKIVAEYKGTADKENAEYTISESNQTVITENKYQVNGLVRENVCVTGEIVTEFKNDVNKINTCDDAGY